MSVPFDAFVTRQEVRHDLVWHGDHRMMVVA